MSYPTISVITTCYNEVDNIGKLIKSLQSQTDKDFDWIVADGGSTDGTLELLNSANEINLILSNEMDFGIYDAMNRAIKLSTSDYYVEIGADDQFNTDAIENYRKSINFSQADVIVARMLLNKKVCSPRRSPGWLSGHKAYVSEHAVATMFRVDLHDRIGFYSAKFPIAADHDFILDCVSLKVNFYNVTFVAGVVGDEGVSSTDVIGSLSESFRVQIKHYNKPVQMLLYILRLFLHYRKIK
jgi:glycosyltransferase involved in cell wall biosynthesis